MRRLCRLDDIAPGTSRGFGPPPGGFTGLFAVRPKPPPADQVPPQIYVYVNACPHIGVALDWTPNDFLTRDGANIVCSTHGALFTIATGLCTQGPCQGDALEPVPAVIEDGWILVPDNAGL